MSVAWVAVGAGVLGTAVAANSASKAQKAQTSAADQSNETQRYMYDTTRADNAPFLQNGTAANNRLAYLMGLSPTQGGQASTQGGLDAATLREQLLPQYTRQQAQGNANVFDFMRGNHDSQWIDPSFYANQSSVDEAGLSAEIQRRLAEQSQVGQQQAQSNDPAFGSLTRKFTMADRDADPVYQSGLQFGLQEGEKGINRLAAARGSFLSGATLKALTRFGNDYGSTKAGESYNRFNNDNSLLYNRLAGLSGTGQTASGQVGMAGANMANQVSATQQGLGNARGSGYLTTGNAIQNGLNQSVSGYKNYLSSSSSPPITDDGYSFGLGPSYNGNYSRM